MKGKKGAAYLAEIFSGIQAEGLYLGERQIFLRFSGCNLRCDYCDTARAWKRAKYCSVRSEEFYPAGKRYKNPLSLEQTLGQIDTLIHPALLSSTVFCTNSFFPYHCLSLTGGEPLLQAEFLSLLIPLLKKKGLKIYLETNGTLPYRLKRIIDLVDFISMDIKLPSATGKNYWKEHHHFLKICQERAREKRYVSPFFIKIVITRKTYDKEIKKAVELIREIDEKIPLVLQPVSVKISRAGWRIDPHVYKKAWTYQEGAKRQIADVRIIPQLHRL